MQNTLNGNSLGECKKLPIGDSSFESIRQGDLLYVDKTRLIYKMVDEGKYYFLSRPRRFGKSLTVSTLKCLFQGKEELFEGLWISDHAQWDWAAHPIVLIDFNELDLDTPKNLKKSLGNTLMKIADQYGVTIRDTLLKGGFTELITALYQKTGTHVVVLVDEYDKPIISHLGRGEKGLGIARQNRDIIKHFFGVLKGANVTPCLRFVFFTGVSIFSRVSIFSELNNLVDITMNRHYAKMLGYTQEELATCFSCHIERFAKESNGTVEQVLGKLKVHYNGYRFSEKDVKVYNPFSVLQSLFEQAYKNYWFESGTPAFLVDLLREANWYPPKIEDMKATESVFSTYELEDLKPEALLFQTGYVTIKEAGERLYTFGYPNREVRIAFIESLLHSYAKGISDRSGFAMLGEYLLKEDLDAFMEGMGAIFASIPYNLETKRDEAYFHTVFYLMVCASGVDVRSEVLSCKGRIDLMVEFSDKIYLMEFKCNQSARAGIRQIMEMGYADPYKTCGKKLILMGINFDSEKRNISEWEIDTQKATG